MFYSNLLWLTGLILLFSLMAGRLERSWVSGPMLFTGLGLLLGPLGLDLLVLPIDGELLGRLAELTLALVLFSDAASADRQVLRRNARLPLRLLALGLPLTILFGWLLGLWFFPRLGLFEAALLAALLAPTDAALGEAVVTDVRVPPRLREGLNVESGLNDGICVPIVLLCLALASGTDGADRPWHLALLLVAREIGIGLLAGLVCAGAGVALLHLAGRRRWLAPEWRQIPVVALALLCFSAAQWLAGSGFIAAFCGGLLFGALGDPHRKILLGAARASGDTLSLITWLSFGAVILGLAPLHLDPWVLLYSVLSLTLVRMLPVFLVTGGMGLGVGDRLFVAWFGPRGMATIVFAVLVLDHDLPGGGLIVAIAGCTVLLSVIAHGVSANPWVARMGAAGG